MYWFCFTKFIHLERVKDRKKEREGGKEREGENRDEKKENKSAEQTRNLLVDKMIQNV